MNFCSKWLCCLATLSVTFRGVDAAFSNNHLWLGPVLVALQNANNEAEAEAAFSKEGGASDPVIDSHVRNSSHLFKEVQRLIRRSWWNAAKTAVQRAHRERIDLTSPVSHAVNQMKQEAEELLRWLEPSYAHPSATRMATRWAQDQSVVMLAARFAPRWEAVGANLAVYSTEKGQGHVDKVRTAALVNSLLRVNITKDRINAEIVAKAQNSRKRYLLSISLFDEILPSESSWTIAFRRAQGSMQMSRGAEIPELHVKVRKRWPYSEPWPSLSLDTRNDTYGTDTLWDKAPGLSPSELSGPSRTHSVYTCARAGRIYCRTLDGCVGACDECMGQTSVVRNGEQCGFKHNLITGNAAQEDHPILLAAFNDEDLAPDMIGGIFRWNHSEDLLAAEAFALCFARTEDGRNFVMVDNLAVMWKPQDANLQPAFVIPSGTYFPGSCSHLALVGMDHVPTLDGQDLKTLCGQFPVLAAAQLLDSWVPADITGMLTFSDEDPRQGHLAGTVDLHLDQVNHKFAPLAFELTWGRGWNTYAIEMVEQSLTNSTLALFPASSKPHDHVIHMKFDLAAEIPAEANLLLLYGHGSGGIRSNKPIPLRFNDAQPPNAAPTDLVVTPDENNSPGFASFSGSFNMAICIQADVVLCDAGSAFAVHWVDESGVILGPSIHDTVASEDGLRMSLEQIKFSVVDVVVPPEATDLMVIARNGHAAMTYGPRASFVDN